MSKYCVTIAREFASGGRLIGKKLSERLGVSFYDRELISLTAKETGFTESIIEEAERTKTRSMLYNLSMSAAELPLTDQIYIAQSRVIKEAARQGSCVIVGRAADYVLRGLDGCVRIYIYAPLEERIRRAKEDYKIEEKNMDVFIRREDKKRASYYEYCTQQKWGVLGNYHICVNSSIGIDNSVEVIKTLIEAVV